MLYVWEEGGIMATILMAIAKAAAAAGLAEAAWQAIKQLK
jgi:hypothetical protein